MGYRFWGLSICHLLYRFVASRVKSATWLRPFWSYSPNNIAHSLQLQSDQDCAQFSVTIRLRLCTVCTSNLIKIAHSWHLQSDQDCAQLHLQSDQDCAQFTAAIRPRLRTVFSYNPIKIAHSLHQQSDQNCAQFAPTIRSRLHSLLLQSNQDCAQFAVTIKSRLRTVCSYNSIKIANTSR